MTLFCVCSRVFVGTLSCVCVTWRGRDRGKFFVALIRPPSVHFLECGVGILAATTGGRSLRGPEGLKTYLTLPDG